MRLFDLRRRSSEDAIRVSATVVWEDSERPAREIWAEVAPALGPALADELDGFAVAAAVTAQDHGERRLLVEGTLCPRLRDGLAAAVALLANWFGTGSSPVIEASGGPAPRFPADPPRAAVFLSGGLDSLFSIARNRDRYPAGHPASFRDAIVLDGYIFAPADPSRRSEDYWRRTRRATSALARAANLEPIFVRTNLRILDEGFTFFAAKYHSAALAAVAHLLSRRISSASIAADLDVAKLRPWGSHPVLDPLYSGSALAILHEGIEASRIEKAARIAAWPEGLASLMVCTQGPLESGSLNCGRCEKCLRTLAALGPSAAGAARFERADVTPAILDEVDPGLHAWAVAGFWGDLAETFRARGRDDLAAAAAGLVRRARTAERWGLHRGWKGALRRFDRRFLGSALLRASRRLRSSG
ncbi:MAG TPA: hypothetical protein VFS34_17810 [Thermoanaerobaculia bacterium]|nr:hypothetical protein [Thermoanaerobaculia bacterium]